MDDQKQGTPRDEPATGPVPSPRARPAYVRRPWGVNEPPAPVEPGGGWAEGAEPPAPEPEPAPPEAAWGTGPPPAPWPEPVPSPPFPRGALNFALALALTGGVATVLGQIEAAFLFAVATLFFVAHAADAHPPFARVDLLLSWIPPATGALLLAGLAAMLLRAPHTPLRTGFAAFSAAGALVALATFARPVADAVARVLLRDPRPGHVARLAARMAVVTLWMGLPAWVALRDDLADLLRDPSALVSAPRLVGSLIGYVVLAFAAVGWGVRRDARAALERLGLGWPRLADAVWVALGVVALWGFNSGSEALQRGLFPELWRADQRFGEAVAGVMGPAQMVLLGLSAGVGEEITLRGALQPRLGLVTTALLFALLHVQYSWYGMASILVFGIILGVIRLRRGTTAAILVHAIYDLLAVAAVASTRG